MTKRKSQNTNELYEKIEKNKKFRRIMVIKYKKILQKYRKVVIMAISLKMYDGIILSRRRKNYGKNEKYYCRTVRRTHIRNQF